MTAPRKKLPIGIQSFAKLRNEGCYYVDKTEFALRLIDQGGYFFLSRPRRFRKSLFLDTLKELFEGNQALFEGLYAAKRWDWSDKYPVIRISFGAGVLKTAEDLQAQLQRTLRLHEAQWGLDPDLKFVFLTGVSNFTKVSLFSGLNHLHDITILPEYSTPTFLLKLLSQRQVFLLELSHLQTDTALLGTFDVGNIPTEALMFQAGYLTIAEQTHAFGEYRYRLRYPNREVQQSLNSSLIRDWTPEARQSVMARSRLGELLLANDLDGMGEHLKGFYASLPNEWFMNLDSVVRGQKSEARSCLTTT